MVLKGLVGFVGDAQIFVFRYADIDETTWIFDNVTSRFETSSRFNETAVQSDLCTMVDRNNNFIVTVKGNNQQNISSLAEQVVKKLNGL